VARRVALEANHLWNSGAAVGQYLADQLLIPMALAGGGRFSTVRPTEHARTNIEIIRTFLDIGITCSQEGGDRWMIHVGNR
jgi:RNA 3'-terminal phosphate cyclase (ATP)